MKRTLCRALGLIALISFIASCTQTGKYTYESVEGDPLETRIYTLDNGLKVYMSVNDAEPMIQTFVVVRVGGKNDPAETTGLAHYFEHLMFKGTEKFGTKDYQAEKVLLDQIEEQFEIYRMTSDEAQRRSIYKKIDSLSYEASKYGIANEYDKLMAAIGSKGTNAYTSYDETAYMENIPSNQLEAWAMIQADRFANNVIRGFHTELETVYEEKNMSLTQDDEKIFEKMFEVLFKNHPYGSQTILGSQEHLKNPSITNIKNYYKKWYVPNNMAIAMAGDFDPDEAIAIIDKYFGQLTPNPELEKLSFKQEEPIVKPEICEVYGNEAPSVTLAWRTEGASSENSELLMMMGEILNNGKAGLVDLNINQKQKLLSCFSGFYSLADHSSLIIQGRPREGQSLEEVKRIMLEEIDNLRKGRFADDLLEAVINNYKSQKMQSMESNYGRTNSFISSFVNNTPWEREVKSLEKLSQITKSDVTSMASKLFTDNNYVVINKIQKPDPTELKIAKPEITPILTNREAVSDFLAEVQNRVVEPIQPSFVDFSKDMSILKTNNGIEVLYNQNKINDLFTLVYRFEFGENNDSYLPYAANYLNYLGTSKLSSEEIKQQFYKLACSYNISVSQRNVNITLTGLNENMEKAMTLLEDLLSDPQPDDKALTELKNGILKNRRDSKTNQSANFSRLQSWMIYGSKNPSNSGLSERDIKSLKSEDLLKRVKNLNTFEHSILYYGPASTDKLLAVIYDSHKTPEVLTKVERVEKYKPQPTKGNSVLIAPYNARQVYMASYSNRGEKFDISTAPVHALYNQYFGGGMNSIVFQEMREARGLAYTARASLASPVRLDESYAMNTMIATQVDKVVDAINAFDEIINEMPESEAAFNLAKEQLISNISTQRVRKMSILYRYLSMKDLGLDYDINKLIYEKVPALTLKDIVDYQKKWVKDREYTIAILGEQKDLNIKELSKKGTIKSLSTKEIFGY